MGAVISCCGIRTWAGSITLCLSDVFPFSNLGLLVDRHNGSYMVGFCLSMLCTFLLLNNVLTVFELAPVSDEVGKDRIKGIEKVITCLVRAGDISKVILSLVGIFVYSSENILLVYHVMSFPIPLFLVCVCLLI
uniref:Uncharacterized protein n=1 Tax=Rousettus aegyptiacus TaxID=9407 RepID=A0A7J8BFN0_ROUAE|nr:hypothetical protein HJG63_009883 [Rousettus aegyptiacus]